MNSENQIAENDEIKNFKLIVNNDFKNIEKCTQLIKILINKKLNEEEEEEIEEETDFKFINLFNNVDIDLEGKLNKTSLIN